MEVKNISAIFEVVPTSWGLRGDPYFWEELKHHFANCTLPYCVQDFENEVRSFFYEITGEPLTGDCQVYVAKYAHGGMSSGMVCGSFWTDHGIPLLVKRYRSKLNRARELYEELSCSRMYEFSPLVPA